ncbi:MAG: glycoside hydrolase family 76 protein [bacterium]|nr:glycoside hydrolase family 76 protein [bacterium]
MRKAFFILMMVLPSWLAGQQDYYLDRQQKRIFTYTTEEIRKVVNFNSLLPIEQSCLNWLKNQQQKSNGLVESYESGEVSYTYDDSLAAIVYILNNEQGLACKVFDFYKKEWKKEISSSGKFNGFPDMYKINGRIGNNSRAIGPNAWLLLSLNYYTVRTGDKSYLDMAGAVADWMLEFRNSYNHGLWGGINEYKSPYIWMSTEHNLDAYAAFQGLYLLTRDRRYKEAAAGIRKWLESEMWNKEQGRFYNGHDDPNYATDVSSWTVMSLADRKYSSVLDFAINYAGNKQFYKPNEKEVAGFDFGGTYSRSPFPDKDAVWFEGTGQMVLAFDLFDRKEEARYYLEELKKAVVRSERYDDSTGLPYASNPGTPPYGGWTMPDKPICISSTTWFMMALKDFNAFYGRNNEMEEIRQVMADGETKPGPGSQPYTLPEKKAEEKEKIKESTPGKDKNLEQELFGE